MHACQGTIGLDCSPTHRDKATVLCVTSLLPRLRGACWRDGRQGAHQEQQPQPPGQAKLHRHWQQVQTTLSNTFLPFLKADPKAHRRPGDQEVPPQQEKQEGPPV